MIVVVIGIVFLLYRMWTGNRLSLLQKADNRWANRLVPILGFFGLGVAGYLAYVETQAVQAVCGPVGDCNAVQASPYARLFGVLPIGVLGVIGYVLILLFWIAGQKKTAELQKMSWLGLFALTLAGTLFSIYLTFLEPFVIQAVCIWCLTSSVIMALLLVISTPPGLKALVLSWETDQAVL